MGLTQIRSRDGSPAITVKVPAAQTHAGVRLTETPVDGHLTDDAQRAANAQAIVDAGRRRRGELADQSPMPSDELAVAIIRAGALRRGELTEDRKPETEAEITASKIIEAGRRRRGEI
jgi:hypothetical protein